MKTAMLWFLLLLRCSCCYSSPISLPECPVNFENMNYTIITGTCKGPNYPANICCQAFKQFACPYAGELNDMSNDCSVIMFSYINHYGNYPPGVFSSLCHDGGVGLVCDSVPPGPADESGGGLINGNAYLELVMAVGLQALLLLW